MHSESLINQFQYSHLNTDNTLHVIGVISNYARYHSRYRLYREWLKAMESTPHVKVYTVETSFGARPHEVTEQGNSRHLQLHTQSPIWIKENMINLGVKYLLPRNWKYVCWSDCDVFWRNPGWAQETLHQLQHYPVLQPWKDCLDLDAHGTLLEKHVSFGYLSAKGLRRQKVPNEPYQFAHPGYAWACTRRFWEATQGLMDFAILGSADHHQACSLVNEVFTSMHDKMSSGFKNRAKDWQYKAHRECHGIVGYVPALIEHKFHGHKKKRYYRSRWQILIDHGYDPNHDLNYDEQGVIQLINKPELVQEIHRYNLSRMEDSLDVE